MSRHPLMSSIWSTTVSTTMAYSMASSSTLPITVVAANTEVWRDASTYLASPVPVREVHRRKPSLHRDTWKYFVISSNDEDDDGLSISADRPSQWKSLGIIHFIV